MGVGGAKKRERRKEESKGSRLKRRNGAGGPLTRGTKASTGSLIDPLPSSVQDGQVVHYLSERKVSLRYHRLVQQKNIKFTCRAFLIAQLPKLNPAHYTVAWNHMDNGVVHADSVANFRLFTVPDWQFLMYLLFL